MFYNSHGINKTTLALISVISIYGTFTLSQARGPYLQILQQNGRLVFVMVYLSIWRWDYAQYIYTHNFITTKNIHAKKSTFNFKIKQNTLIAPIYTKSDVSYTTQNNPPPRKKPHLSKLGRQLPTHTWRGLYSTHTYVEQRPMCSWSQCRNNKSSPL
jgi:hypothetical protein